jgi:hypothetical protein
MSRTTKPKSTSAKHEVRTHDPEKTPLATDVRPPGAPPKSPIPTGIEARAQRLIHAAGSVETAKHAVDSAAERETLPDFREDLLAKRLGFVSRQELLAASQPITAADHSAWWATKLNPDHWVVWNNEHMAADARFPSLQHAQHSLDEHNGHTSE